MPSSSRKTSPRKPRLTTTNDHLPSKKHAHTAMLSGVPIRILPFDEWTKDAWSALNRFNFDRWAEGAIHPEDVQKFNDADATLGQVMAFIRDGVEDAQALFKAQTGK